MHHQQRQPIRVFLVDDHRVTLWGLERLVESACPRMQLVGTAASRRELLSHAAIHEADVVVLDLDLGGQECGTEALPDLARECSAQVLVLTGDGDPQHHREAVLRGARGVVHKSESADTILDAIEKVNSGGIWLDPSLVATVLGCLTGSTATTPRMDEHADRIGKLTPKEREVVKALVRNRGAKNFTVADELGISEHTLRNHLTTIYEKLQVHGRLELYLYATEHALVH